MRWAITYALYGATVFNIGLFVGAATGKFYGWTP